MRGREFYMKDGYTFDLTKEDALHAYNRHLVSYLRTYERMGLKAIPMRADSGPIGGEDTHEFLVLAETGESEVFYDSAVTDLTFGDREIDFDDKAACAAVMKSSPLNMPAPMKPMMRRYLPRFQRSAAKLHGALKSVKSSTLVPNIPTL